MILIKPQFEVGRELVGKGGIVRDEQAQQGAVQKVRQKVEDLSGKNIELMESPILGMEGNREFLLHTEFLSKAFESILMKKASIISKQGKPELGEVVGQVAGWLRRNGYAITADAATLEFCPGCELVERENLSAATPNFVIVLGGDGTCFLPRALWRVPAFRFLGVNLGSLGFLTEVKQEEIELALTEVDAGRCELSQRPMLHCQLQRDGKCVASLRGAQ